MVVVGPMESYTHSQPSSAPLNLIRTPLGRTGRCQPPPVAHPSLRQLREVYRGDVVLFTSPVLAPEVQALCRAYNVSTMLLPEAGSTVKTMSRARDPRNDAKGVQRYAAYRQICEGPRYDVCFATDFRDVVFQADPFDRATLPQGADLVLAEEFAGKPIGKCKHNSGWIRNCWGEDFLRRVADRVPICSGTIMGTPGGFARLYREMSQVVRETNGNRRCRDLDGVDQGRLNYLTHSGRLGRESSKHGSVRVVVQPRGRGQYTKVELRRAEAHQIFC